MLEKFFMPLDRQFDDGLEVTASAFKDAAGKLAEEHEGRMTFLNGHLPINFLYRHSIELFLKSSIVTVHRALKLPTGAGPHTKDPEIEINGKWKSLHKTHSLKVLLDALTKILTDNKTLLATRTPSNWVTPPELIGWVDTIEAADGGSTYFRYPRSTGPNVDAEKSGFLPADPDKLLEEMHAIDPGKRGRVIMGVRDDDDNLVEVFAMTDNPLPMLRDALVNAAGRLEGCACGLNAELVWGYGQKFHAEQAPKGGADDAGGS